MFFSPSLNALQRRRAWLAAGAALGLSACGFRLRGSVVGWVEPKPMEKL
jgi:outer membrane lipopolysaccharide assembly protein LptE/RlpB